MSEAADHITGKLANEGFVSKVPAAVVESEKAKFAALLEKVKANMEQITALHGVDNLI
ncbi:TPA: hypothetical protein JI109_15760 [Acinetobacter baumannii]|nr:hypothetical protein [Acinetobacter baumannii]